ncbi:unnamed protein product [Oreochromis niloticus]|nr:unnamed protein product [Mustela putorius furo]
MNTDIPANNKEVLFERHLLKEKEENSIITAIIGIRQDQTSQSREIIAFYKRPQIDWAGPFHCSLQGAANMTLLFEGQQNHLVPSTSQILADSDFVVAGRMIGHSFLNDGPRLHGLSKAIIHIHSIPAQPADEVLGRVGNSDWYHEG